MPSLFRAIRIGSAALAAAGMLMALSPLAHADTGSVRIRVAKAGFIIGVGGGSGVLHFHGRNYPFSVGGMSVGTIGAASADLVGRAYNLRSPTDIIGTYGAIGGSIAVAAGVKAVRLQNQNGVVLELQGRQAGFEASLALSGVTISMR
jgi:hypothetical protein